MQSCLHSGWELKSPVAGYACSAITMTISTYLSRTSVRAGGPLRTRHVNTEFATARSSYLPTQQTSRSYTTFRNAPLGTPSARFSPLGHRANVFRHPDLNAFRPNSQHRTVFSLPKTAFSVLRLPIAAAGTGAGVMAFMQYKVNGMLLRYFDVSTEVDISS